jgi:hypothetical protein
MAEDRISRLSKRFETHAVGRQPTSTRSRERKSFYLDGQLVGRLDKTYRDVSHELYPNALSKSVFLETLLEYGLGHLPELTATLKDASSTDDTTDNS